ncbi:MAG: hypothetical protein B7X35_03740 [Halothiobacillus sp. 14-56-357]|jgi:hypothetical protein|uniref:hypothetical protein n=1 Tax=Halothiobacillus sp. 15-55-196 TaxID=1970382 RepID=UPI000BD4F573|nr:hypothetical protein [Halothiobacillus sp. 15-55-196]OZB35744.1 MAG: hypothetical protein B7X44_08785 [Halothiobacillus sp. 15-55-196]OZB56850.1 MAG: hypothetical protein B7X35_03740 [Halothiobacillus sp. 14-56-357]OZB79134.1 MAG: hypothetical protein B7X29_02050 [Halothiobacillus sp. 13-55-115]
MRIQRSTFDFLMISAILGSVVLVTSFFGYGAGTLVILFWVLVILSRLKRVKKAETAPENITHQPNQADNKSQADNNGIHSGGGLSDNGDGD